MQIFGPWGNGAVFQWDKPLRISGRAASATDIQVHLYREEESTPICSFEVFPDSTGYFESELQMEDTAEGCFRLEIQQRDEKIVYKDLAAGEVWVAAGQSNMAITVKGALDTYDPFLEEGSDIRFFNIRENSTGSEWMRVMDAAAAADMSAVGFAFARGYREESKRPVGIICAAEGGSPIEAWMPRRTIESNPKIKEHFESRDRLKNSGTLFNERIIIASQINVEGILWLQGESSAADVKETKVYRNALKALIHAWRIIFRNDTLPFIISQIAGQNYQPDPFAAARINESIHLACEDTDSICVPIYDLPLDWIEPGNMESHPIHPLVKKPVGERMAKAANNKNIFPKFKRMEIKDGAAIVYFSSTGDGLAVRGNVLRGFTLAGPDGVHLDAQAEIISEDAIKVSHPHVKIPVSVTYAFSDIALHANLCTKQGHPAIPFRSEKRDKGLIPPKLWASCDLDKAWVNSFEWTLGGAGYKPLWKPGEISGTQDIKLSFDRKTFSEGDASLKMEYELKPNDGGFAGASPQIKLPGYASHFQVYDYLTLDILNPDPRPKEFTGLLIRTIEGRTYLLQPVNGETTLKPNTGFESFKVDLKTIHGCYLLPEKKTPPDLSDICSIQWTFRDPNSKKGVIFIDNIQFGRNTK